VSYVVEVSAICPNGIPGTVTLVLSSVAASRQRLGTGGCPRRCPLSTPGLKAHFLRLKITQPEAKSRREPGQAKLPYKKIGVRAECAKFRLSDLDWELSMIPGK